MYNNQFQLFRFEEYKFSMNLKIKVTPKQKGFLRKYLRNENMFVSLVDIHLEEEGPWEYIYIYIYIRDKFVEKSINQTLASSNISSQSRTSSDLNKEQNISIKPVVSKVKLATIVEGDQKAPFSIATTPRCRGGRYSSPWIAPLYP